MLRCHCPYCNHVEPYYDEEDPAGRGVCPFCDVDFDEDDCWYSPVALDYECPLCERHQMFRIEPVAPPYDPVVFDVDIQDNFVSVLVVDANRNHPSQWVDTWVRDGVVDMDFNQYIFGLWDYRDVASKEFQESELAVLCLDCAYAEAWEHFHGLGLVS